MSAHLAELRSEVGPDVDLAARLGDPATYAAELRAAAGYPEAPARTDAAPGRAAARAALVGLVVATGLGGVSGLWLFSGIGYLLLPVAAVVTLLAVPVWRGPGRGSSRSRRCPSCAGPSRPGRSPMRSPGG